MSRHLLLFKPHTIVLTIIPPSARGGYCYVLDDLSASMLGICKQLARTGENELKREARKADKAA
jgi:hypothetical protein